MGVQSFYRRIDLVNKSHKLISNNVIKQKDQVLLSFSGGQDSICLLLMLNQLYSQLELHITFFWCHHLWQTDSFYLMQQVAKLSFLFQFNSCFAIPSNFISSELLARKWRQSCSYRVSFFSNNSKICLAHTFNDKIETIFFNFMRGTGLTKLSPLRRTQRISKSISTNEKHVFRPSDSVLVAKRNLLLAQRCDSQPAITNPSQRYYLPRGVSIASKVQQGKPLTSVALTFIFKNLSPRRACCTLLAKRLEGLVKAEGYQRYYLPLRVSTASINAITNPSRGKVQLVRPWRGSEVILSKLYPSFAIARTFASPLLYGSKKRRTFPRSASKQVLAVVKQRSVGPSDAGTKLAVKSQQRGLLYFTSEAWKGPTLLATAQEGVSNSWDEMSIRSRRFFYPYGVVLRRFATPTGYKKHYPVGVAKRRSTTCTDVEASFTSCTLPREGLVIALSAFTNPCKVQQARRGKGLLYFTGVSNSSQRYYLPRGVSTASKGLEALLVSAKPYSQPVITTPSQGKVQQNKPYGVLLPTVKGEINLVRPLLFISRFEIKKICSFWRLPLYPDTSNQKVKFLRNRVRQQFLPTIKFFFNSKIENSFLQLAEIVEAEDYRLTEIVNKFTKNTDVYDAKLRTHPQLLLTPSYAVARSQRFFYPYGVVLCKKRRSTTSLVKCSKPSTKMNSCTLPREGLVKADNPITNPSRGKVQQALTSVAEFLAKQSFAQIPLTPTGLRSSQRYASKGLLYFTKMNSKALEGVSNSRQRYYLPRGISTASKFTLLDKKGNKNSYSNLAKLYQRSVGGVKSSINPLLPLRAFTSLPSFGRKARRGDKFLKMNVNAITYPEGLVQLIRACESDKAITNPSKRFASKVQLVKGSINPKLSKTRIFDLAHLDIKKLKKKFAKEPKKIINKKIKYISLLYPLCYKGRLVRAKHCDPQPAITNPSQRYNLPQGVSRASKVQQGKPLTSVAFTPTGLLYFTSASQEAFGGVSNSSQRYASHNATLLLHYQIAPTLLLPLRGLRSWKHYPYGLALLYFTSCILPREGLGIALGGVSNSKLNNKQKGNQVGKSLLIPLTPSGLMKLRAFTFTSGSKTTFIFKNLSPLRAPTPLLPLRGLRSWKHYPYGLALLYFTSCTLLAKRLEGLVIALGGVSNSRLNKKQRDCCTNPFLAGSKKFSFLRSTSKIIAEQSVAATESRATEVKVISKTFGLRKELKVIPTQLIGNKDITLFYLPAFYYLLPLMKYYYATEISFLSFGLLFSSVLRVYPEGVSQFKNCKEPRVEKNIYKNSFYPTTINSIWLYSLQNTNTEIKDLYFFKFFLYFLKLRLKNRWIYWPNRIVCLPLAFHRRLIKLFLLKQNKKNIRYSKIDLISNNILAIS